LQVKTEGGDGEGSDPEKRIDLLGVRKRCALYAVSQAQEGGALQKTTNIKSAGRGRCWFAGKVFIKRKLGKEKTFLLGKQGVNREEKKNLTEGGGAQLVRKEDTAHH